MSSSSSSSFRCKRCNEELYLDMLVVSASGKRIPLNRINDRPHQCPNSEYRTPLSASSSSYSRIIRCNKCTKQITFSDDFLSNSGKKIPLDMSSNKSSNKPHQCSVESVIKCYGCGNHITFKEDRLSESGKKIPLDATTYSPHQCINKPPFGA